MSSKDFDFGQFFKEEPTAKEKASSSKPQDPMAHVHEFLQSIMNERKQPGITEVSEEEAKAAFEKKYGSAHDFMTKHMANLTAPLEKYMVDGLHEGIENAKVEQYNPVVVASCLALAHGFHKRQIQEYLRTSNHPAEAFKVHSTLLMGALNAALPNDDAGDSLLVIHALLTLAELKLTELAMHQISIDLAEKEKGL